MCPNLTPGNLGQEHHSSNRGSDEGHDRAPTADDGLYLSGGQLPGDFYAVEDLLFTDERFIVERVREFLRLAVASIVDDYWEPGKRAGMRIAEIALEYAKQRALRASDRRFVRSPANGSANTLKVHHERRST
jgi:hypothetical protein